MIKILLLLFVSVLANTVNAEDAWLLVNTRNLTLEVKKGDRTIKTYSNIAIGRRGAGFKKKRGDDVTPVGTYKIAWINEKSPYKRFYGFNYPSEENAVEALRQGIINEKTYDGIIMAHRADTLPAQNTPLGGRIGIHGLGKGDLRIHQMVNWTHGCVAVTNKQLDSLAKWIGKGTVVKIK